MKGNRYSLRPILLPSCYLFDALESFPHRSSPLLQTLTWSFLEHRLPNPAGAIGVARSAKRDRTQ